MNFEETDALSSDFTVESLSVAADPVQKVILTKEERIDKLFNDIGGLGKFQFFAFFVITFGISGMNYCIFILGYLI